GVAGFLVKTRAPTDVDSTGPPHPKTGDDKTGNFYSEPPAETRSTRNLVASVQKPPAPGQKEGGRAIVVADSDALSDPLVAHPQLGNALLLLDGVKWPGGDEAFIRFLQSEADAPSGPPRNQAVGWCEANAVVARAPVPAQRVL